MKIYHVGHGVTVMSQGVLAIEEHAEFWSLTPEEKLSFLDHVRKSIKYAQHLLNLEYIKYRALIRGEDIAKLFEEEPAYKNAVDEIHENPFATPTEITTAENVLKALDEYINRIQNTRTAKGSLRQLVIKRDRSRCRYCGYPLEEKDIRIDHVIPYSLGGETEYSNLVVACEACNVYKGARTPEQCGMELRPVEDQS